MGSSYEYCLNPLNTGEKKSHDFSIVGVMVGAASGPLHLAEALLVAGAVPGDAEGAVLGGRQG